MRGSNSLSRSIAAANYYALHNNNNLQRYNVGNSLSGQNLPTTSTKSSSGWPQASNSLRRPSIGSGAIPLPSRLSRVRSEEVLDTRSEPDLRLPTMAQNPYLNNSERYYGNEELGNNNSRWFVALYDYDHHMSPNLNAQQEELSFRKHQLIKVNN